MLKTTHCPVCQKELLESAYKNHLINMAKSEVWDATLFALDNAKCITPHFNHFKHANKL